MATFSDFYRQRLAELGSQPASATPVVKPLDLSNLPTQPRQSENPAMGALNWAIDILSRPLYGVTNAFSKARDDALEANKDAFTDNDPWGAVGNSLKTAADIPLGFLEGFFSNNPEVKRTGSDVIEQTTDAFGTRFDPNYVDEQDNVNPVLKGVAGFGVDILADPLTWIPGAQIAKAGSLIGKGAKAGIELAEGAVKGAREAAGVEKTAAATEDAARLVDEPDNFGMEIPMPKKTITAVETPEWMQPFGGETSYTPVVTKPVEPVKMNDWDVMGPESGNYYDAMVHAPDDPAVKASYDALESKVIDQYRDMKNAGINVKFEDPVEGASDIYKNSKEMLDDVLTNKQLRTLKTTEGSLPKGHPMDKIVDIDGEQLPLNDVFRAVHDYFGHAKSGQRGATVSFGPRGEWEAWRTHRLSLPKDSWQALWTETRGQNTWTNYFGDNPKRDLADRPFAAQKAGTVPESLYAADLIGDEGSTLRDIIQGAPQTPEMRKTMEEISSSVGKKAAPLSLNDWIKKNGGQKLDVTADSIPGGLNGSATVEKLAKIVQGDAMAHGGKLAERGQAALNYLKRAHQQSESVKAQVFSNTFEAFKAKQQQDLARLTNTFGDKLMEELSSKNSPQAFGRTFNALKVALDPTTDLAVFAGRNKGLLSALRESLAISEYIKPSANTWDDLARADSLFKELSAESKTFDKTLSDYTELHPHQSGVLRFSEGDESSRTAMYKDLNRGGDFAQYTLVKGFNDWTNQRMIASTGRDKLFGADRARAHRDAWDELSDKIADVAQTEGLKLSIGVGKDLIPLSFGEVYRAVSLNFENADDALLLLHNQGSATAMTPLLQTTYMAIMAGDLQALGREGVIELRQKLIDNLLDEKKYGVKGKQGQMLPNNAQKTKARGYNYATRAQAQRAADKLPGGKVVEGKSKTTGNPSFHVTFNARAMADRVADAIIKAQPSLVQKAAANATAWTERATDEGSKIYNKIISAVKGASEAKESGAALVDAVNKIPNTAVSLGKEISATQLGTDIATSMAKLGVGEQLLNEVAIATKLGKDLKDPTISYGKAFDKAAQARADNAADEVYEAAAQQQKFDDPAEIGGPGIVEESVDDVQGPVRDISPMDEADVGQGIQKNLLTPIHQKFNQYYGMQNVRDTLEASGTISMNYLKAKNSQIAALAKTYPREELNAAFQALRQGDAPAHLAEQMKGLESVLDDVLPVGDKGYLDSAILRNEGSVKNINEAITLAYSNKKGPFDPPQFDYGLARMAAKEAFGVKNPTGEQIADMLAEQWKSWEIGDDPLDFLSRMTDTVATVSERKMFATSFVNRFTRLGLVSDKPKPGMVKIVSSGKSTFRSYLPDSLYVDKDLAGELHRADALVRTSTNLQGELGHAVRKYFLPWQNMWKSNITVMRPGHHIRNAIGDGSITWMQRGNRYFLSSYKDAQRVLGFKNNYTDMDLIAAMKNLEGGEFKLPQGGDVLIKGTGKWAGTDLTIDGIHQILQDSGMLSNFHRAEDLLSDALEGSGATRKITDLLSLEGTKIKQVAGGVSEYTAHMGRAQHFIQAMKQELTGKGRYKSVKSMDELIQKVAREVKKTHPDGSMLTTFEKKYLRVIIPFYSWFGKTLPVALEATLRHPGRFMAMPKASYELAVAMGINPDSLSNPFPEDQLFPSFLTNGFFGPQFQIGDKYVNVNPGFAVTDVFSSITPPREALGMISPLLRMPVELATGSQMATGSKINDTSDYLDQNTPFLNYLANLTGVSPTGSVGSVLTGQGLDPQLQVQRGNKDGFDQVLSGLNWLTGLNFQNWSRPNFVNYAEIEKRNEGAKK